MDPKIKPTHNTVEKTLYVKNKDNILETARELHLVT